MNNDIKTFDFAPLPSPQLSLRVGSSSSQQPSENDGLTFWDPTLTPATSPIATNNERLITSRPTSSVATTIEVTGTVLLSFMKGSKLFKLKYTKIDIFKDLAGGLRSIELSDSTASSPTFIHTFLDSRKPIPHLEQPTSSSQQSLRVSFLEDQGVQIAQTVFNTQPRYTFEKRGDCDKFEEAVLGQAIIFAAGVAEITSKGRGEEAMSQNLRVTKSAAGTAALLYFANSLRKDKNQKRYVSIATSSISSAEMPKKSGKPVVMKFFSEDNFAASLKSMSIIFLDDNDARRFCTLLQTLSVHVSKK